LGTAASWPTRAASAYTSLGGKAEALVETPQEAVAAFRHLPLHGMAMPPYLVTKRHEPALPA